MVKLRESSVESCDGFASDKRAACLSAMGRSNANSASKIDVRQPMGRKPKGGCPRCLALLGDALCDDHRRKRARSYRIRKNTRKFVLERDGYKCVHCGCDDERELTMDHIIPRSKGGSNKRENLQTLCQDCNRKKADRLGV